MSLLKMHEIREMTPELRDEKLREVRDELMHERGIGAMGGAPASPGKIKALRKNIARLLTVQREVEINSSTLKKSTSSAPKKKATSPSSQKKVKTTSPSTQKKVKTTSSSTQKKEADK